MPMPEEKRLARLAATRQAAISLAEDLAHIRAITSGDPTATELRRLSGPLRRIVVEGDLTAIAAPRVGKIHIPGPENNPIYKAEGAQPFALFSSANVTIFGVQFAASIIESGPSARPLPGYNPDARTHLSVESFMNQRVLCLNGHWVSRRLVIKYVANVLGGVHSGEDQGPDDLVIARLRLVGKISLIDQTPQVSFDPSVTEGGEPPFEYNPAALDFVLLEVLATARSIVEAPDVQLLEDQIRAEIGMPKAEH